LVKTSTLDEDVTFVDSEYNLTDDRPSRAAWLEYIMYGEVYRVGREQYRY
jgi:DNA-directed RNA polymerase I, II, and III subunit RPABC3